jgi:acyl-coenzyme A synthetase/AMP-(fatty) acid ligase
LLHGHPHISDAAIVGIPDAYSGELPRAFVVLRPGVPQCSETEKELQEYVKSRKARPKWLAGGIEFVDSIPKSSSGKILRRVLKGQWKEMAEAEKQKRAKL